MRWVEFAAEFSDLPELNLPTVEELGVLAYYSLDVVLVLTSSALLTIFVAWKIFNAFMTYKCIKSDKFAISNGKIKNN